jgi:predicted O-linked N-acetylglucosamine transferase (SPINDLY family)
MNTAELQELLTQAQSLHKAGQFAAAETAYLRLVEQVPANADVWHLLGVIAYQQGDAPKAIPLYRKALELRADFPQARNNLGLAFKASGRIPEAADAFAKVLLARPEYAEAAYNLALMLEPMGRAEHAEQAYRHALAVRPDWLAPLGNLGNLLRRQQRVAEAEALLKRALQLAPDTADALGNLALLRIDQGRFSEARELAERAAIRAPDTALWWETAGSAARLMLDADGAIPHLQRAAQLAPDDPATQFELGLALETCGDDANAAAALARAERLAPDWQRVRWRSALLLPAILADDAEAEAALARFDAGLESLAARLDLETPAAREAALEAATTTLPFNLHYLPGDHTRRQIRFGDLVAKAVRASLGDAVSRSDAPFTRDGRVRVGFVSSYLRNHIVARFFAGFITGLERTQFETWAWFNGDDADDVTAGIAAGVEHFNSGALPLATLAERIRSARLDVLVFPDLGLDPRQHALASLRLAPVQAAFYGHPVTSGLDSVDYFLSGDAIEPPHAQAHYRESLVRLPGLGAACVAPVAPGDSAWAHRLRAQGAPHLMCLQHPSKIAPQFDAVIAEILARSGARLVCFDRGAELTRRFRARLEPLLIERGVAPGALHVEPLHPYPDFLAGIAAADLILDTPGFSGGGTSLDALGTGAAIVAFDGSMARARQTSAMLRILGVEELIAADGPRYVELTLGLLADRERLAALRERIRGAAPRLFDARAPLAAFAQFLRDARPRP